MTPARKDALRRIMQEAWSWFAQVGGTFADALRTAWRAHRIRSRLRVELQPVKTGATGLSPLRDGAHLATRRHPKSWGTRHAPPAHLISRCK